MMAYNNYCVTVEKDMQVVYLDDGLNQRTAVKAAKELAAKYADDNRYRVYITVPNADGYGWHGYNPNGDHAIEALDWRTLYQNS